MVELSNEAKRTIILFDQDCSSCREFSSLFAVVAMYAIRPGKSSKLLLHSLTFSQQYRSYPASDAKSSSLTDPTH